MYQNLFKHIMNPQPEKLFYTATVVTVNPLTVELIPDDVAIPATSTTQLLGLKVGSRVVLVRIYTQFIAIAVIGDTAIQYIGKNGNQNITGTDMVNITDLVFTLKANSGLYAIDLHMNARNDTSATPDGKFDWEVTGADYTVICARNMRGGEAQTNSSTTFTACRNSGGHGMATDISFTFPALTTSSHIQEHFVIQAGATDTIFQYRGSQITNGTNDPLIISGYSHIIITKLAQFGEL